ncbi:MAG: sulfate transporter CysZ, partial [Thermodesulfobacteriota bacterium]
NNEEKTTRKPGLISGLLAHWRGLDFILRHPRLIPLILIPVAINILLFLLVFYLALAHFGDWLNQWLTPAQAWYWAVLYYLLLLVFLAGLILAAVFTFTAAANILASPFNDALSERTELIVAGAQEKPFSLRAIVKEAGRTVVEELKKILFFLVVFLILLLFNLIPIAGQLVYGALMTLFTILWLGLNFLDYAFARHGFRFGAKIGFVRRNPGAVFGYGLGVFVWLLVPLLNLALIPVAVVGGTLLYLELSKDESPT